MVLPHATVVAVDSPLASKAARSLAASAPNGFEINSRLLGQEVILCAGHSGEMAKWVEVLQKQAQRRGSGFLMVHCAGRALLGGSRQRYFCHLHSGRLLGFVRPRDGADGVCPGREWLLDGAAVRALTSDTGSLASKALATTAPYGFEVEDLHSGQAWQFVCESVAEEEAWMHALRETGALFEGPRAPRGREESPATHEPKAIRAAALLPPPEGRSESIYDSIKRSPMHSPAGSESPDEHRTRMFEGLRRQLAETFNPEMLTPRVCKDSSIVETATTDRATTDSGQSSPRSFSQGTGGSPEAESPRGSLLQLRRLEATLAERVASWSDALAAAEEDCRQLLLFFGLEAPSGPHLGAIAMQLLEQLALFQRQLKSSWLDLEKHRRSAGLERAPRRSALQ